ncbi:MAG: DNA repair protein RecO [Pseudomonadota bacterium]
MPQWEDEGILISLRPYQDHAALASVLTAHHGRHAGLVRSLRRAPLVGSLVDAQWRGRLSEHLGNYQLEPRQVFAAPIFAAPLRLLCLQCVCAMIDVGLPERASDERFYLQTKAFFSKLEDEHWLSFYALWELAFIETLGFGLDLAACALTGVRENLAYISPRTGRAVTREAARPWARRLLPLPALFLLGEPTGALDTDWDQALRGLQTTGYFLHYRALEGAPARIHQARRQLIRRLRRAPSPQGHTQSPAA